ncbi:MAG: type II toxin-antitoxin system RelE/ParE family toxin [Nanoarchaeota archaeon]
MYSLSIKPELDKTLEKLFKKDRLTWEIVLKKAEEILQNPQHYKNLRAPLQKWKRVHISGSFVLAFSVDENTKTVTLEDFDHHDEIYKH